MLQAWKEERERKLSRRQFREEHYLISLDLQASYVDFSAYEKYRMNRGKGFFRKIIKPVKNPYENYPEGLFTIEEET